MIPSTAEIELRANISDKTDPGRVLESIDLLRKTCRQVLTMVDHFDSMAPIEKYFAAVLREEAEKLDPISK